MKKNKLTSAMFNQLMEYLKDVNNRQAYWGNKDQFWKRHWKIGEWVMDKFNHGE